MTQDINLHDTDIDSRISSAPRQISLRRNVGEGAAAEAAGAVGREERYTAIRKKEKVE
jgi:hypothetical protein